MGDKSRFQVRLERSRELRREQTKAERLTWGILPDRQTHGLKFWRQVPIDDYIVDFYCDEMRIIVELDGDVHEKPGQKVRDERRDKRLAELGYTLIRIPNGLAINDPDRLRDMVRSLRPSPGASHVPLPEGEGL
jgi:very-short-patch-repair endonuclease